MKSNLVQVNFLKKKGLLKLGGIDEIISISKNTGVSVQTICADYFMEAPLHSNDDKVTVKSFKVLERLLEAAEVLKAGGSDGARISVMYELLTAYKIDEVIELYAHCTNLVNSGSALVKYVKAVHNNGDHEKAEEITQKFLEKGYLIQRSGVVDFPPKTEHWNVSILGVKK